MTSVKTKVLDMLGDCFTAFENDVLSQDKALLPQCALDVIDGKQATKDYWFFLLAQANTMALEEQAR